MVEAFTNHIPHLQDKLDMSPVRKCFPVAEQGQRGLGGHLLLVCQHELIGGIFQVIHEGLP